MFITQLLHVDTSHPYFTYSLPFKLKYKNIFDSQHANKHFGHLCNMTGGINKINLVYHLGEETLSPLKRLFQLTKQQAMKS